MHRGSFLVTVFVSLAFAQVVTPQTTLTIQVDQPGAAINPAMWGVFFEDINFGADGGLYAELVKNRSFEFPQAIAGWHEAKRGEGAGLLTLEQENPSSVVNSRYLRLKATHPGYGVSNEGFRGMGIREGESYVFAAQMRMLEGTNLKVSVELVSSNDQVLAQTALRRFSSRWNTETVTLKSASTDARASLRVLLEGEGIVDLDMVSLFPKKTWKGRPGGLRADLVQMLADLKPGFIRFPGGCIVEGRDLTNRYQWKNTIGYPSDRPYLMNRWNVEFARRGRGAPDYYQSFGLGFFEYFQLCDDLGAEPLPILNCGMACQFNTGQLVPLEQLDPYIQDALDLIEFANGSPNSKWGSLRAKMGHRRPFDLKMLGVGNEQWGPEYIERYSAFAKVLKEKHPEIQLISAVGPDPSGARFDFLWGKLRELKADLVDEHFYRPPAWFLQNVHRYDNYDRMGPKVFAGEFAAHLPNRANSLEAALAEAAAMTGFERNADVVRMASYAPLFAHVDAWQWNPDLIWFDNLRVVGTPNYYVQQLFSRNRGDVVLPLELNPEAGGTNAVRFCASAVLDRRAKEVVLKAVNVADQPMRAELNLAGAAGVESQAQVTSLAGELADVNTLDAPRKIVPLTSTFGGAARQFAYEFPPRSLTVLRIGVRR